MLNAAGSIQTGWHYGHISILSQKNETIDIFGLEVLWRSLWPVKHAVWHVLFEINIYHIICVYSRSTFGTNSCLILHTRYLMDFVATRL